MNKQTIIIAVAALLLLGAGIFGTLAFTGRSDPEGQTMTMPDGTVMPVDQMSTTPAQQSTTPGMP